MNTIENIKQRFDELQLISSGNGLSTVRENAFTEFNKMGIPTSKHEEWKYTRVSSLFNKEFHLATEKTGTSISKKDVDEIRLPGFEDANELIFVNGIFSYELSNILSNELNVISLEEAAKNEYKEIVSSNLGHSSKYLKDGINALNTALLLGGIFINVKKGKTVEHPVYIYNIIDSRAGNILSQPRCLVHIEENANIRLVETYSMIGSSESFSNQVMEIVVEKDAVFEYYKIQNSKQHQVSTTHIRQVGKSYVHTVVISLEGGIVRNNLNVVLEAEHCEAHLYGLYFPSGDTHIDNHTVVDNVKPHSFSNEFYKGVLTDKATGVFNGKIYVQPQAQKTNAYQSNKNILLSNDASVNTKPQLEIFADDVKCSHGCTVGQLDEEALFYLRSRGISDKTAKSMLVHAFADDILEHIKPEPIRRWVDKLISERLDYEMA